MDQNQRSVQQCTLSEAWHQLPVTWLPTTTINQRKWSVFAVTFKQTATVSVRNPQPAGCEMSSEAPVDNALEDPESVYIVH
ncbi:hypothetical protein HVD28_004329 [Salmonella enterica]|nr:hypothetical protein [Salmonella enterica]